MANERIEVAESVLSVLESVRTHQPGGRLVVVQYNGGRIQEGEIYLQTGQPVYARLGQLVGQEALNRLLTWRNIQYTLYLDEPINVTTQQDPAIAASKTSTTGTTGTIARQTGARPERPISSPLRSGASIASAPPRENTAYLPGLEWLVPQKSDVERDVMSLPLTRPQRFTYFLVDGRRTVADLSRCTGKTIQELDLILSELRAQGLVVI